MPHSEQIDLRNVFVSVEPQEGGLRLFCARGTSRELSQAGKDEVAWLMEHYPGIEKMILAFEHKPEGV